MAISINEAVTFAFSDGLMPDQILSVSQWAERHRMLSNRASAEPGRWRNQRTPYLVEIMDALSSHSEVEEIRFMKGAQIGATEAGNNWLGYIIDQSPAPTMCVLPTVDMAKRSSKQRIQPLIDESPRLSEKVKPSRERDSGNTTLMKEFPGGILVLTGANSAAGLRSMAARNQFCDEIDAYPGDVDGEGDPLSLAKARTRTFSRRKLFYVSTPTISGRSRIESLFEDGDRRFYFVPCPHCGEFQKLIWSQIKWENDDYKTTYYSCIQCKGKIEEHHKTQMLEMGEWRSEEEFPDPKIRSYHLSGLYSPVGWFSWCDAVKAFLESKDKTDLLRAFVNTVLGETWKEKGDAPDWKRLYERRESYEIGVVQPGVVFLTAAVDVQKDRLEFEVVGWGRDKQSWSIDYGQYFGDPSNIESDVWKELDKLLAKVYPDKNGGQYQIKMLTIDSGSNTSTVYSWSRKHPISKVSAIKGQDTASMIVAPPKNIDVRTDGKRIRRGLKVWNVGVSIAKTELYSWLNQEKPTDGHSFPYGYCHYPQYGEEFFKQLTAEQVVAKIIKGYRKYYWEKTRERNEALDLRIYNRAAAAIVGMDRFTPEQWDALDITKNGAIKTSEKVENSTKTPPKSEKKPPNPQKNTEKRRSSFW